MLEREPSPISAAHTPRQQRGVLDKGARTGVQERKPGYTRVGGKPLHDYAARSSHCGSVG